MIRVLVGLIFACGVLNALPVKAENESRKIAVVKNFIKSPKANRLVKSNKISYGIQFDSLKWQITKNFNESAELSFGLKGKDAYAFMINENIKIPMEVLKNYVIDNLATISESYDIIELEDRIINGLSVKYIRADAIINGVKINYMIYLHCGNQEVVQIYGYFYGKNSHEVEEFMNGLIRTK